MVKHCSIPGRVSQVNKKGCQRVLFHILPKDPTSGCNSSGYPFLLVGTLENVVVTL